DDSAGQTPLQSAKTDAEGHYRFDGAELNGAYRVQAAKEGFLGKRAAIQIGPDGKTYGDLWLEPARKDPAVIQVDTSDKKPVQMQFGFNEYVIQQTPYHPFNEPSYVEALKHSGANIMRFPGGTIANFYDWKNDDFMTEAIRAVDPNKAVPRDQFATEQEYADMVAKFTKYLGEYIKKGAQCREARGRYGFTDFLDMSRQIGADIYYVVNIQLAPGGVDPVDYLAAWMQKLKDDGAPVKYVELGNEIVTPKGAANSQAILNGLYDLDRYMQVAQAASRRVKAIFPDVKIGILADGLGNKIGEEPNTIDLMCRKIVSNYPTDFYDAVVMHTYLRINDKEEEDPGIRKDKVFAIANQTVKNSLDHWRTVFPGKEVWMTETGFVVGTPYDEKNLLGCQFTALLEADYYLRWVDNDDMARSYVKFYSISNKPSPKSCMFRSADGNSIIRTPVSYGYELAAGTVRDASERLGTTVQNSGGCAQTIRSWAPEKDAAGLKVPGKGEVKNVDVTVDYVFARAFRAKSGGALRVVFINKSQAPREARLKIDEKPISARPVQMRSISGGLFDRNTLEEPDKIIPVERKINAGETIELPAYSLGVLEIGAE
ncbi:MAG: hypothetical protein NTW86_00095, partial [Candidatus Sumerlaeota bacterium]|nr:hypothetical protein [Candidatus Sumerlaeota bacterium]